MTDPVLSTEQRLTFRSFIPVGQGDPVYWDKAINDAIDYSALHGQTLYGTEGVYNINSALVLKSGARVECEPTCIITRVTTDAPAQLKNAYVTLSCDTSSGVARNIRWSGGRLTRARSNGEFLPGNVVDIEADDITIENIVVDGWYRGRAFGVQGNDVTLVNPTATGPSETSLATAGIRVTGGTGFRCFGGYIESHDDTFVFAPGAPSQRTGNRDISDGAFIGCRGKGQRLINASVGADPVEGSPDTAGQWLHDGDVYATASVRNVRFEGVSGTAEGNRAIKVVNENSSGVVENVVIENCEVTVAANLTRPVVIQNYAGGVRDITLRKVSILDQGVKPTDARSPVVITNVEDVSWIGGRIDAPWTGSADTVVLEGVVRATFADLSVGNTTDNTFGLFDSPALSANQFAIPVRPCSNVLIENCNLDGVSEGNDIGIRFVGARACGGKRLSLSGSLSAGAISGASDNIKIVDVRHPAVAGTYQVTIAPKIVGGPNDGRQPFIVQRGTGTPTTYTVAIGQGFVETVTDPAQDVPILNARGVLIKVITTPSTELAPGSYTFTVTLSNVGKLALLSDSAEGCYISECDLSGITSPFTVAPNRGHRLDTNTYTDSFDLLERPQDLDNLLRLTGTQEVTLSGGNVSIAGSTYTNLANASVVYLKSSAATSVTGLTAGPNGRVVSLVNTGSAAVTLVNNAAGEQGRRFLLQADLVLPAGGAVLLRYDMPAGRWRMAA